MNKDTGPTSQLDGWEFVGVILLCLLCFGEPDLLDALIQLVFSWIDPCVNVVS